MGVFNGAFLITNRSENRMAKTGFAKYGWSILCILSVLSFLILLGRVAYIQSFKMVDQQNLNTLGKSIWTKEESLKANRGRILDRNGLEIARDTTSYTIYAILDKSYPDHVKDPAKTAEKLAPLLNIKEQEIKEKLSKKKVFQVEFGSKGKNLKPSIKNAIEEMELTGIGFRAESTRFYPNGAFASHAIGYSQFDEKAKREVGRMGIEATYDKELTGKDGSISYQTDRKGYKLPDPKEQVYLPQDGNDVYLTIDQKIQTFLEEAVHYSFEEYEPAKITAIVADPKTGEILAMANAPSFDPNVRDINNYQNDAIKYAFEPGSTMKIYTIAAAINEGVWNPNATYQSGTYKITPRSKAIRDHNNGQGWGTISYLEGIHRSSNVLVSKLVNENLGTEKFKQYLDAFDFDAKTGIDLPGEEAGTILYQWPIEKITTSFGQGTTVTPIQQIKAMTAIANNGKMMKPYVVKKVVDSKTGKVVKENKPTVVGTPVTAETAKTVLETLEGVVHAEVGTGRAYNLEGYKVSGKTGTAQIPDPEGGGYLWGYGNNTFSFMGAVPSQDPQFIMFVSVQQPKLELKDWGYELGSDPVSYIFRKVMANTLFYKRIEQTEIEKVEHSINLPNLVGSPVSNTKESLKDMKVFILGNGNSITNQYPLPSKISKESKVYLVTDGDKKMPDMKGWSLRDVLRFADLLNIEPTVFGNGYVTKQSIKAGEVFKPGSKLFVELNQPNQPVKDYSKEYKNDLPKEDKKQITEENTEQTEEENTEQTAEEPTDLETTESENELADTEQSLDVIGP